MVILHVYFSACLQPALVILHVAVQGEEVSHRHVPAALYVSRLSSIDSVAYYGMPIVTQGAVTLSFLL